MNQPRNQIRSLTDGTAPHRFEQFIEKKNRIYVNRNLRMNSIKWVGFDMDHTLAHYNRNFIEGLAFDLAREALILEKGYSENLRQIRYDPEFGIRGLIVDKEEGNILKMDKFHYVTEAFHGSSRLDKVTRKKLYTSFPLHLSSGRFWSSDTLFGLPEISLYSGVVQALEESGEFESLGSRQLFDDIRYCVDLVHRNESLKSVILDRIGECVLKDPKLPHTLAKYRREGIKLFLLTNSDYGYSDKILSYVLSDPVLDRPWWDYFDLLVVDSLKPRFFIEENSWQPVTGLPHEKPTFRGGNFGQLEREMRAGGDEILYVGDHIFGDILRSKKSSGWRTQLIVEELEHEIRANEMAEEDRQELDQLQIENGEVLGQLNDLRREIDLLRSRKVDDFKSMTVEQISALDRETETSFERERKLNSRLTTGLFKIKDIEEGIKQRFNRYWGPLCKVDGELSRFGDQLGDFACVYTSRVSNYLYYPPGKYFVSPVEFLPHEIQQV